MKKLVLFLSLIILSVNMKAQLKAPYVKWTTVPAKAEFGFLKASMNGQNIAGATVNSTTDDYSSPLGDMYPKVTAALNAGEMNHFAIEKSKGGEINYGIDANGKAVQTGTLPAGVDIITFDGIPIAKWGTNGCLNALSPAPKNQFIAERDPDEIPFKESNPNNNSNAYGNTNPNGINITVNGSPSNQNNGMDWNAFNAGQNNYRGILFDAISVQKAEAALLIEMQDSKQCCGNSGGTMQYSTGTQAVYTQQPMVYTQQPAMVATYQEPNYSYNYSNVKVRPNWTDVVNTAANVANSTFYGINTFRGYRFDSWNNGRRSGGGWNVGSGGGWNGGGPWNGGN